MTFPDFSTTDLDFSGFRPLDHSVWRCSGFSGGRRAHLRYRWEFQWRGKLRCWFLCRAGRHDWVTWYSVSGQLTGTVCSGCDKAKPLTAGSGQSGERRSFPVPGRDS